MSDECCNTNPEPKSTEAVVMPEVAPVSMPADGNIQAVSEKPEESFISIDDFFKVTLKVGQIVEAVSVPKSSKLLKFMVDVGEASGPRQILSGIAKRYNPEELVGRKVTVVANLKPAKLMGFESRGMLLCSSTPEGELELLAPESNMPVGAKIS